MLGSAFSQEPPLFSTGSSPQRQQTPQAAPKSNKPLPPTPPSNTPPAHNPPTSYTPPPIRAPSSFFPVTVPSPAAQPASVHKLPSPPVPLQRTRSGSLDQKGELLRQATQTLQRRLDEFLKASTKDIDMFIANQNTLQSRSTELERIVQTMQQEENELEKGVIAAIAKGEEIEDWIARNDHPTDIDTVVVAEDSLSNQLLNVIAEDNALEDVLYYLGKGLANGKMDADAYLKEVRNISRQQFFIRALSMKLNSMVNPA